MNQKISCQHESLSELKRCDGQPGFDAISRSWNSKAPNVKHSDWSKFFHVISCIQSNSSNLTWGGGQHSTVVAYLLLTQLPWVWFLAFPRIFLLMLLRFINSPDKNSGQRLDTFNQNHLVLASGKIVLRKSMTRVQKDFPFLQIFFPLMKKLCSLFKSGSGYLSYHFTTWSL